MTDVAASFQDASKQFGAVRAVDRLDLSIECGQTVALLGANGASKSTAVGMLLGLVTPQAGRVEVLGGGPDRAVAAGRVGAMLQDGGLMAGVSVRRLVELACRIYPRARPVPYVLALAGLEDIAGRQVDRLSGGQAQRLRFGAGDRGRS